MNLYTKQDIMFALRILHNNNITIYTLSYTEPTGLDSGATMEAVMNENACNPIVRSVARSYISVAERYDLL